MSKCFLVDKTGESNNCFRLFFHKYNIGMWIRKSDVSIWDWEEKTFARFNNIGSFLALKNRIPHHKPNKIEPIFNQQPIEELNYEKIS